MRGMAHHLRRQRKMYPVDLEGGSTCQVNRDCPSGAYCLLGECQPKCFRSLDCPNTDWYCSLNNTCQPKPTVTASGDLFDPRDFTVRFAQKNISIDMMNDEYKIPMLIMNRLTKKQEYDNPSVIFGYRLEVSYGRKLDPKCSDETIYEPDANGTIPQAGKDCIIEDHENFITLQNPYGTLFATGDPTMDITLDKVAAANLNPGIYTATVKAFFNNGDQTSSTVMFQRRSPSGKYLGRLNVYMGRPETEIGETMVSAQLRVDTDDSIQWRTLMENENLDGEDHMRTSPKDIPLRVISMETAVRYLTGLALLREMI